MAKQGDGIGSSSDTVKIVHSGAPERNNFSGEYPIEVVRKIILEAKKQGVDPKIALAVALRETNLGTAKTPLPPNANPNAKYIRGYEDNPFHVNDWQESMTPAQKTQAKQLKKYRDYLIALRDDKSHPQSSVKSKVVMDELTRTEKQQSELSHQVMSDPISAGIRTLKTKMNHPLVRNSDEETQIQNYNGMGKVNTAVTPMYGKSSGTIDFGKEHIYGQAVLDLKKNAIEGNQTIENLISQK